MQAISYDSRGAIKVSFAETYAIRDGLVVTDEALTWRGSKPLNLIGCTRISGNLMQFLGGLRKTAFFISCVRGVRICVGFTIRKYQFRVVQMNRVGNDPLMHARWTCLDG